jgi:hypothetical protein
VVEDGPAEEAQLVLHLVAPLVREDRRGRVVAEIGDRAGEEVGVEVDRPVDAAVRGASERRDAAAREGRVVVPDDVARADVDAAEPTERRRPVVGEPLGGRRLDLVARLVGSDRLDGSCVPRRDREDDGQ